MGEIKQWLWLLKLPRVSNRSLPSLVAHWTDNGIRLSIRTAPALALAYFAENKCRTVTR